MQKINLRELYPDVYKTDVFVDVAEEVVAAIRGQEQDDAAYERRKFRHKAHYSLNREDGIENDALNRPLTPEEILEQKQLREEVYAALMFVYAAIHPDGNVFRQHLPQAADLWQDAWPEGKPLRICLYAHHDHAVQLVDVGLQAIHRRFDVQGQAGFLSVLMDTGQKKAGEGQGFDVGDDLPDAGLAQGGHIIHGMQDLQMGIQGNIGDLGKRRHKVHAEADAPDKISVINVQVQVLKALKGPDNGTQVQKVRGI